ncbi:MAG: carboxypeptidase regulatory-like domain-containing protein, partial [Acidimicrobiales bacterium]
AKGCEDLGCSESSLLSSGEFMVAPTDLAGENPDPAKAPHVVNNSWGGGPGDPFYQDIVNAWRAAGIFPVFSAGNPGPDCGAGGSPGDYNESFSVGATDIDDVIAEFSGRGPSVFGKINPDVSAPGVDVVSSVPGDGYEAFSGTSMAAPHTAGTIALVLSSAPELIGQIDQTVDIVRTTALDIVDQSCGGDPDGDPNNVYGEGRINAEAAVLVAATGGTLTGTVTDVETGDPIPGAEITAISDTFTGKGIADPSGAYTTLLPEGTYTVLANAFGYETAAVPGVVIVQDETTTVDFTLQALPRFTVSGQVTSAENGRPLVNVTVRAVGTPVEPATTNRDGRYSLILPVGTYTLEASQGGCLEVATAEVEVTEDVTVDFALGRKLDHFGHGCKPIPFRWGNAPNQTAIFGDDVYGRLLLPEAVTFYGAEYTELFIGSNGHVGYLDPLFSPPFPTGIPDSDEPNAAIYPLWQDLVVDGPATVNYGFKRSAGVWSATIEYRDVRPFGGSAVGDFQVKVFDNEATEIHWGEGVDDVNGGSRATIGIENAEGDDALQYGFHQRLASPGTAIRFEVMANATITGVVTNANDGLPVEGASVVGSQGGQDDVTDADGRFVLKVINGSYQVTVSADDYVTDTQSVSVGRGETAEVAFSLAAAQMEVTPESIEATVDFGETASSSLTISNTGTATLDWEVKERETSVTPPDLPPAPTADGKPILRPLEWEPFSTPAGAKVTQVRGPTFEGPLAEIIDDPDDDALHAPEITSVSAGSDGVEMSVQVDFAEPPSELGGFVFLDVDQDPNTGLPADALFGKPTQDVGMEVFADMFSVGDGLVLLVDALSFEIIAEVPAEVEGSSVRFDAPLEILGDDDGALDVAMVLGDFFEPTDWAPDVGHGTIEPFRDAPWMAVDPVSGSAEPGESDEVTVTLGGDAIAPGTYEGELVVLGNDPRTPQIRAPVTLVVTLPENFGSLAGSVTDSLSGEPVPAATMNLGSDPPTSTTSADDGTYLLFGPEGTWDLEVSAEGYLTDTVDATIAAGVKTTLDVVLNPAVPVAVLEGGPIEFSLSPGETGTAEAVLRNAGFVDLEFEIAEVERAADVTAEPRARPAGVTSRDAPKGNRISVTPSQVGGPVLVFEDALPWDTDALHQVLDANGIVFDVVGSDQMDDIDLSGYQAVIIANDQPQDFYDAYNANVGRLEEYAAAGGLVWVEAASLGFNEGEFGNGVLPGGGSLVEANFESSNDVADPAHPTMAGVPDPFTGDAASHSAFQDLPPAAHVIATGSNSGLPTMVEFPVGAGWVLATGQTLEFAFEFGEDGGVILENTVPYVASFLPLTDVPWLSTEPTVGVVAPAAAATLTVT